MAIGLRRLRALAPCDRRLLFQAAVLIVLLRTGLQILRFPTLQHCLQCWADRTAAAGVPHARIVWAVQAAGSRLSGTTCLVEALVAHTMLRRHGFPATLKVGVRRGAAMSLDAHAWVECGGAVIIGTTPGIAEYSVLSPNFQK
jgi:hypothetical protein